MRRPALLLALLLLAVPLAGCLGGGGGTDGNHATCTPGGSPAGAKGVPTGGPLTATLVTSMGNITVDLAYKQAPVTVSNFVSYVSDGFYNGTIFHRVVKGFVAQGGGYTRSLQQKPTHLPIPLDANPALSNVHYTLAMARTSDPNSATSQFFINLKDNPSLNPSSQSAGYAVFGIVTKGRSVVDAMGNVSTHKQGGFQDLPDRNITIQDVTLHTPDVPPAIAVVPYLATYCRAPGAPYAVPFQVQNGWDKARTIHLAPTDPNDTLQSVSGNPVTLPPGGTTIVLVHAPGTFPDHPVGVQAISGNLDVNATSRVVTEPSRGPAAGSSGHERTTVRYLGLLTTGVPFDTDVPALANDTGLMEPYGMGHRTQSLNVWAANGSSGDKHYIQVIPGFQQALQGLHGGQTTVAYTPPAQAYKDGVDRWFYIQVESVK